MLTRVKTIAAAFLMAGFLTATVVPAFAPAAEAAQSQTKPAAKKKTGEKKAAAPAKKKTGEKKAAAKPAPKKAKKV
jgi:hypothetical protein